jgi:hypothetical protein
MKKILASVAVVAAMFMSCGSPNCDAMKAQCTACTGAAGKLVGQAACNTAVDTYLKSGGNADAACKTVVDAKTFAADSASCK